MGGFILVLIFLLLANSSVAAAIRSNSLVYPDATPPAVFAFGDSLSDVGNNEALTGPTPADSPYYGIDLPGGKPAGRFSNGYNLVDVIAQYMGFKQSPPAFSEFYKKSETFTGVNFASAGSGIVWNCTVGTAKVCYTLQDQIEHFKKIKEDLKKQFGEDAAEALINKSIFTFTCGDSDVFYLIQEDNLTLLLASEFDAFLKRMMSAFEDRLKELYDLGARKFMIVNAPVLGMAPAMRQTDFPEFFKLLLNERSKEINDAEKTMLQNLSSTLPSMKYLIGSAYEVHSEIIDQPDEFGIKNTTNQCCGGEMPNTNTTDCAPGGFLCPHRDEYLFWDAIHPTQTAVKHAVELFYNGNLTYATPINLKQLIEDESQNEGTKAM